MVNNIKILVELFAYLYCLAELFGKKFKVSIYSVVLIILGMFLAVGIDNYGFPEYFSSLVYVGIFLYGLVCYRESIKTTLINCVLASIVVTMFQLIIFLPLYAIFFKKYGQGPMNELLINMGCAFFIILFSYKFKFKKLSDFIIKRNKLIIGVAVLILCGFGYNFYQMKKDGTILSGAYIQVMYFFFIFLFIIYEWQKSRMDAEKKKTQLEMNWLYYDAYDQLILLIRQRQHDMKSHISTIKSLIFTTDNYDELVAKQEEYCDYVLKQNEKVKLVLTVENPLIAGFLYSKIQIAENKEIEIDYHVNIKKKSWVIPEYELIEMAGILIDNAIDALENARLDFYMQEPRKKICVTIKETLEEIELTVANTSNYYGEDITAHFFENGYSSKGKDRGIGLSKLKHLVRDRKGDIIVSNEFHDNINYLTFTIKLPKGQKTENLKTLSIGTEYQ